MFYTDICHITGNKPSVNSEPPLLSTGQQKQSTLSHSTLSMTNKPLKRKHRPRPNKPQLKALPFGFDENHQESTQKKSQNKESKDQNVGSKDQNVGSKDQSVGNQNTKSGKENSDTGTFTIIIMFVL